MFLTMAPLQCTFSTGLLVRLGGTIVLALGAASCDVSSGPPDATLFGVPIEGERGIDWYYGTLPNHGQDWDEVEDYTCGTKTRDFNVNTDFLVPSFRAMERGVSALAAAPGEVVEVHDGEPDVWLAYQLGVQGNYVRIRHRDGLESVYRNLKNGSIRVQVGDRVEAGDPVGQAGSSGESNWPRVGFEARTSAGQPFDPWAGECSPGRSYWVEQPDYPDEFQVIDFGTIDRATSLPLIAGRPPDVTSFQPGQVVGFWAHVMNRPAGALTVALTGPELRIDSTAVFEQPDPANTVLRGHVLLPSDAPAGTWVVTYALDGEEFVRMEFQVTAASPAVDAPNATAARPPADSLILPDRATPPR